MQDTAVIAPQHVGDNGLECVEAAVDIHSHDALEIREIDFVALDVGASGDARAVDEDIEAPSLGRYLIHDTLHRKGIGDIDLHSDGRGTQRVRGTLQRLGIRVEKHEPHSARDEALGDGQAEPVGSASDHRALSGPSR
jgi:hypothetical protein